MLNKKEKKFTYTLSRIFRSVHTEKGSSEYLFQNISEDGSLFFFIYSLTGLFVIFFPICRRSLQAHFYLAYVLEKILPV